MPPQASTNGQYVAVQKSFHITSTFELWDYARKHGSPTIPQHVKFADGKSSESERHLILDFQAGKDVGLGMFGGDGSSAVSAGVRIRAVQLEIQGRLRASPDCNIHGTDQHRFSIARFQRTMHSAARSFHDYSGH